MIADCEYYKEISNLKVNKGIIYKPYYEITKLYIEPCLKEIHKNWKDKLEKGKSNIVEKLMFEVLDNVLLPNIWEKELHKSIIIPHAYGMDL